MNSPRIAPYQFFTKRNDIPRYANHNTNGNVLMSYIILGRNRRDMNLFFPELNRREIRDYFNILLRRNYFERIGARVRDGNVEERNNN